MNTNLTNRKSLNRYPTQVLTGTTIGQTAETVTLIITTIGAVTPDMKSQSLIEKPIDHQVMILIQVLVKEINLNIKLTSKEIVD